MVADKIEPFPGMHLTPEMLEAVTDEGALRPVRTAPPTSGHWCTDRRTRRERCR